MRPGTVIGALIAGALLAVAVSAIGGSRLDTPGPTVLRGSFVIDFGEVDGGDTGAVCLESAGQTLSGAADGNPCVAAAPAALMDNATNTLLISCFVSAANTVKVRICATATSIQDPASTTYYVRVFP